MRYASPAWRGFATAADKQRIEAYVRRTTIATDTDDVLGKKVLTVEKVRHPLKELLPRDNSIHYNLRTRRNDDMS